MKPNLRFSRTLLSLRLWSFHIMWVKKEPFTIFLYPNEITSLESLREAMDTCGWTTYNITLTSDGWEVIINGD